MESSSAALNASYESAYRTVAPPSAADGPFSIEVRDGRGPRAIVCGRPLPWDTEVLGVPCGRIDGLWAAGPEEAPALERALDRVLAEMDRQGLALVDLRIGLHAYPLVRIAEERGFRLVDVLNIYLSRTVPGARPDDPPGVAFAAVPSLSTTEAGQARKLCRFEHSRLYQDSRIPGPRADAFYARLFDTFAAHEETLKGVARDGSGRVVGFYMGKEDAALGEPRSGCLWMIATDPTWSGRGLGRSLLDRCLRALHETCTLVEIGTQVQNGSANRLYQRAGLPIVANVATLHRWNPRAS